MRYETFHPTTALQPYVEFFWILNSDAMNSCDVAEIVLPDGKMELIVHFGDQFSISRGKRFSRQARSLLAGQMTEKIFLKPTGTAGMIAARFRPAGAAKFFDFPMNEVVDQVVDLHNCLGSAAQQLEDRILNTVSDKARVEILEKFLIDKLRESRQDDCFVDQACRYILQSNGAYDIATLTRFVGLSERQVERKFQNYVGVSPKFYSRVVRFQKFISMASEHPVVSLTDAALVCGYYDQAHFIRDFKSFSGVTPSQYLAQVTVLNDFFFTSV